ncbi:nucleoside triphosphate pyrophosphohydrolase family protein [uncultured Alistipes sp.]|uniref:nucleoside triphosphate pyrophosphohydrolase family protein n=1 Tax=uncultured Alistipes sp. TaxID=538949 RepID=UPI002635E1EE|nr:nucleoside triphosphate pyrophosphohydrolase family protein [uncultured Alistipes sp.]
MELNEYQKQAMTTCAPTAENFVYMMLNLMAESGELAGKAAKAIRKGEATIDRDNNLRHPSSRRIDTALEDAMRAEAGDVLWQLAGLCHVMGWELEAVGQENLAKLKDRQRRDVIVGEGDNR